MQKINFILFFILIFSSILILPGISAKTYYLDKAEVIMKVNDDASIDVSETFYSVFQGNLLMLTGIFRMAIGNLAILRPVKMENLLILISKTRGIIQGLPGIILQKMKKGFLPLSIN